MMQRRGNSMGQPPSEKYEKEPWISFFKVKVIEDGCGRPYLVRFSLFQLFGFSLKLHIILRGDQDRELHDHPWTFITLMLAGGYYEETFTPHQTGPYQNRGTIKTWYGPGSLRINRSPHPHRLDLQVEEIYVDEDPEGGVFTRPEISPAVTLVLMFPKKREWGFYTPSGWLNYKLFSPKRDC